MCYCGRDCLAPPLPRDTAGALANELFLVCKDLLCMAFHALPFSPIQWRRAQQSGKSLLKRREPPNGRNLGPQSGWRTALCELRFLVLEFT